MRAVLLLFSLLLALPAAAARSLAVLPLDQAAKSDSHEGLGRALAGMLVSDLSQVEELELVERARLDAVLKEIELAETGFLDPKTAVKLGNGVGAEWVVIGSWSVVGETFLMDARAVDVKSGKIVAAVDANGTVTDFVTVEKSLVEDLLVKLQVAVSAGARRKIIADAPTEDFQAMSTYGAGLQAEFEGRYEEALKKFQEAAKVDPEFVLSAEGAAAARKKMEQLEADRKQTQVDDETRMILDALAKSPDEMKLTGRTNDPKVLGGLSVRWGLLEHQRRWCQLVDELYHYIERHKGKEPDVKHPDSYNHRHWAAYDLGLYDERPEIWQHGTVSAPFGWSSLVDGAPSTTWMPNLVVGITDGIDRAEDIGGSLLNASVACAGPDVTGRITALEKVMEVSKKYGIADRPVYSNGHRPVWTEVEILLLQAMAARDGMSPVVQQRTNALLDFKTGSSDDDYAIRSDVAKVVRVAERTLVWQAVSDGISEAEIERVAAAAAASDAKVVELENAACKIMVPQLANTWTRFESDRKDPRRAANVEWSRIELAVGANSLRLAGCIRGTPAVIATLPEALAWVDTMPQRLRAGRPDDCQKTMADLVEQTKSYRQAYPGGEDHYRGATIMAGMRAVRGGCATIR
ncbi:MAG: hypothetical protein H6737_07505 [Alphaproteobacteria bacterium]|nr:hypothetical protein [Alphaproteobacteria bacterium]